MLITHDSLWRDAHLVFETPVEGGAPSAPATTEPEAPETGEEPFDRERAMATIRNLREFEKTAKRLQRELDDLKKAEEKRQEAELTAVQLAEKRAQEAQAAKDALEQRYRTHAIETAVRLAATQAGFIDPEDAVRLADLSAMDLDENDQVQGATEAVKDLAKAKPHLLGARRSPAPDINSAPGGNPPPQRTTREIAESQLQKAYRRS